MDSQDKKKTSPSAAGHESHGVHLCHKCGWPFPNPHPSAKHRRAHKRICGTIEGYKLINSVDHNVSDDEHGSDEDREAPSPKIEKSTNEITSGGIGERSHISENEVFSDAVTEFLDTGFSPVNEELLEGARLSDKSVENVVKGDGGINQQLKFDATAGIVQQPNSSTESSQMHDPKVLETETHLLGRAVPAEVIVSSCNSDLVVISNSRTEELAGGLGSVNGSAGDLSPIKPETLTNSPKEDGKANIGDHEMQSSTTLLEQEIDVTGNEESNVDEVLSDVAVIPSNTANKAYVAAVGKIQETDLKTSDSATEDQIVELKEEQSHELGPMSLHNLSPEVESCKHTQVLVKTAQIESDSSQDRDVGGHGDSVEGCYTKGEENENVHVLSVGNDIALADHPEIMVEDFKDHKAVKSNLPVTLDSGEVIEPVVDNKDTVYDENHATFHSSNSGETIHISSAELRALEGNLKQEDGGNKVVVAEVLVDLEADTSELKVSSEDLGSNGIQAPPETTMSGKIRTDTHLEGQQPYDCHTYSSQDILPESTTTALLDVIPVTISADDEVSLKTNLSGGNNTHNHEKDETEKCDTDGKESGPIKEELSTDIETTSESVDDLSVSKADQTTNFFGAGNSGDQEKAAIEFSDVAGNESRDVVVQEKPEMKSKVTLESACNLSESKLVDGGMDKVMDIQGTETTTYFGSDSTEVGAHASHSGIITATHSGSQKLQDEDSQEAMKEPKFSCRNEVLAESVGAAEVSQKISEILPEHLPVEADFTMKSSAMVEDSHCRDGGLGASGISTDCLKEEGDVNLTKQPVDVSVDSSSQTDSLEGNWGSVSVLSIQSDALAAIDAEAMPSTASEAPAQSEKLNLQKPKASSEGYQSNKSDVFEPPSFATLVEPGDGVDKKAAASDIQTVQNSQQPKSEALQAGWFPSLTNVVNESPGRKKNEEIIAKVTNWSTGRQHTPLKTLLGEANLATKKSPNPKQTPAVTMKDENTTKNNDASATTVNSTLVTEAPATDQVAKREMGREWNSPARYPSDNKKEKRKVKGRPNWVPFVCCSSIN